MWILIFVAVLLTSHFFLRWWKKISRWDHFPGYSKLGSFPVIGHGHLLQGKDFRTFMRENKETFGDIYRMDLGEIPTVFLCNYDDVCEAYRTDVFGGRTFPQQPGLVAMRIVDKDGDVAGLAAMVGIWT